MRLGGAALAAVTQPANLGNGNDAPQRRRMHGSSIRGVFAERQMRSRPLAPSNPPLVFHLLPWGENTPVAQQRRPGYSTRASDEAGARHCHSPGGRAASPLRAPRRLTSQSMPAAPAEYRRPRPRLSDGSLSLALSLKRRGHEIRVKLLLHRMDRTYRPTRRYAWPPDSAATEFTIGTDTA